MYTEVPPNFHIAEESSLEYGCAWQLNRISPYAIQLADDLVRCAQAGIVIPRSFHGKLPERREGETEDAYTIGDGNDRDFIELVVLSMEHFQFAFLVFSSGIVYGWIIIIIENIFKSQNIQARLVQKESKLL